MNRITNNITVICYDITSNKLRCKIDQCLKDFGIRLQFSVFLCRLDADGVARCRTKLMKILEKFIGEKEPNDSLIIFERLHPSSADCLLGERIEGSAPDFSIF